MCQPLWLGPANVAVFLNRRRLLGSSPGRFPPRRLGLPSRGCSRWPRSPRGGEAGSGLLHGAPVGGKEKTDAAPRWACDFTPLAAWGVVARRRGDAASVLSLTILPAIGGNARAVSRGAWRGGKTWLAGESAQGKCQRGAILAQGGVALLGVVRVVMGQVRGQMSHEKPGRKRGFPGSQGTVAGQMSRGGVGVGQHRVPVGCVLGA